MRLPQHLGLEFVWFDVVRIGYEGEHTPVILWIGIQPETLTREDGTPAPLAFKVALACRQLLEKHGVTDVECEIRETECELLAGPKLMAPVLSSNPTADVQVYLTPTLGTCISTKAHSNTEGTLGFYVTTSTDPGKIFGVTARHVLFPPDQVENKRYEHRSTSQRRHVETLPGDATLEELRERVKEGCQNQETVVDLSQRRIQSLQGRGGDDAEEALEEAKAQLNRSTKGIDRFNELGKALDGWTTQDSRVVGYARLSPAIDVGDGPDNYTIDWAMYEVDTSRLGDSFSGNVIDLGTKISPEKLTQVMNPNVQNPHKFSYPVDRQLSLQGTIPINEMKHPEMKDKDGSPCLLVLKRGRTTEVTYGIANEIFSCVRYYFGETEITAMEWSILPYDKDSGAFSARGDSGAVVVDARSRMGGLLTGGAGVTARTDITYVTPMVFLLRNMEKNGVRNPNTNVGMK
jgi:hypothetical protein